MLMPQLLLLAYMPKETIPNSINPPVVVALSSDDPYESRRSKNLFSALIAAMIPERFCLELIFRIKCSLNISIKFNRRKWKGKVNEQPKTSADGGNQQETEMGSLDLSKAGMIGYCLLVQNKIVWTNALKLNRS